MAYDYIRQVELTDGTTKPVGPETFFKRTVTTSNLLVIGIKANESGIVHMYTTCDSETNEYAFKYLHESASVQPTFVAGNPHTSMKMVVSIPNASTAQLFPDFDFYTVQFGTSVDVVELRTLLPNVDIVCLNDTYSKAQLNTMFTAGYEAYPQTLLNVKDFGDTLPSAGTPGRIFFKKI